MMKAVFPQASEHVEARIQSQLDRGLLKAVEGRLQRVNYSKKEIAVVTDSEIRYFQIDKESQLWFDDQKTILRCFHPLDQVKLIFQEGQPNVVKSLCAWERQMA